MPGMFQNPPGFRAAVLQVRIHLPPAESRRQFDHAIAIPAIALSMVIMSMRNTTYSIHTSVYVVYLEQAGLVGTTIGMLIAAAEIASGFGALFAGRAVRLGDAQRDVGWQP